MLPALSFRLHRYLSCDTYAWFDTNRLPLQTFSCSPFPELALCSASFSLLFVLLGGTRASSFQLADN